MPKWFIRIFVSKAVRRGVRVVAAKLSGDEMVKMGVTVDPLVLELALWAKFELLSNFVKVKFQDSRYLGWLAKIL